MDVMAQSAELGELPFISMGLNITLGGLSYSIGYQSPSPSDLSLLHGKHNATVGE